MLLPNTHLAIVESEKILDYLLNSEHPIGKSKARFFESAGFTRADWPDLAHALKLLAQTNEIASMVESPYGVKYIVDGELTCPDGRQPMVRTVWILDRLTTGELTEAPRLVTAHPL